MRSFFSAFFVLAARRPTLLLVTLQVCALREVRARKKGGSPENTAANLALTAFRVRGICTPDAAAYEPRLFFSVDRPSFFGRA